MSLFITDRQRGDLENAIADYLRSQGEKYAGVLEAFKAAAGITEIKDSGKGLLEKKWTSVVRLQKKVMEMEAQMESLKKRGAGSDMAGTSGRIEGGLSGSRLLPKPPATHNLSGHRAEVTSIAAHPVYSYFVSGSADTTIRMWDHESGQYERTLKGHTGPVTGLAFDARGTILASSSADLSVKIWDMNTFACTRTIKGHDHTVSDVKFMPNGANILTCSRDNTVKMFEVATGFCTRTYTGHSDWVRCLSISLDGHHMATGSCDQSIIVWRISTGQIVQTMRGHQHVVDTICYGKKPADITAVLAAASSGGSASSTGDSSESAAATGKDADSKSNSFCYLASGSRDRTVKLWDTLKGDCLMTFTAHENWVRSVLIHPSGKYIISCSDDKSIRVLDTKEGRLMRTISDAHSHFVSCLSISQHYPVLVSGGDDNKVSVWSCV